MASSRNETQITWSASNSVTCNDATWQISDAFSFNIEDWEAALQVNADNQGTPADGDNLQVKILWSTGDVLGDTGDDYDTEESGEAVMTLDTFNNEDPARRSVPIPTGAKGFKVAVKAPQGASRSIVARARVITHRPQ